MMRILVTGGGGFLGQALCRGLVERGHQVLSFNRGHYPVLAQMGVGQIQGDLADPNAVAHAVAGVDAPGAVTRAISMPMSPAPAMCWRPAVSMGWAGWSTPPRPV